MSTSSLNDRMSVSAAVPTRQGGKTGPLNPLAFPTPAVAELATQDTMQTSLVSGTQAAHVHLMTEDDVRFPDTTGIAQALSQELRQRQPLLTEADLPPDLAADAEQMLRDSNQALLLETDVRVLLVEKGDALGELIARSPRLFVPGQLPADAALDGQLTEFNRLLAPLYTFSRDAESGFLTITDRLGASADAGSFCQNLTQLAQDNQQLLQAMGGRPGAAQAQQRLQALNQAVAGVSRTSELGFSGDYARQARTFLQQVQADVQAGSSLEAACQKYFRPEIFVGTYPPAPIQGDDGSRGYLLHEDGTASSRQGSAADLIRYTAQYAQRAQAHLLAQPASDAASLSVSDQLTEVSELSQNLIQETGKLDVMVADSRAQRLRLAQSETEVQGLETEIDLQKSDASQLEALDQELASGKPPEVVLQSPVWTPRFLHRVGLSQQNGQWLLNGRRFGRGELIGRLGRLRQEFRAELRRALERLFERFTDLRQQRDNLGLTEAAIGLQRGLVGGLRLRLEARREALIHNPAAAGLPDYQRIMAGADAALQRSAASLQQADQELEAIDTAVRQADAVLNQLARQLGKPVVPARQAAAETHSDVAGPLLEKARIAARATLAPRPGGGDVTLVPARELLAQARAFADQRRTMVLAQFAATVAEQRLLQDDKLRKDRQVAGHLQKLQQLADQAHARIDAQLADQRQAQHDAHALAALVQALQPVLGAELGALLQAELA